MKAYLITYTIRTLELKAVVIAESTVEAIEKFIAGWQKELEEGTADIPPDEMTSISVEIIKVDDIYA